MEKHKQPIETSVLKNILYSPLYAIKFTFKYQQLFDRVYRTLEQLFPNVVEKFQSGIIIIVFMFIPIFILFFAFGDSIITILFQRGKFSSSDTSVTFEVLRIYSLSLIFYASYTIINKMLYSTRMLTQLFLS